MNMDYKALGSTSGVTIYPLPTYPTGFCVRPPIELAGVCARSLEYPYDLNQTRMSPDSTTSNMFNSVCSAYSPRLTKIKNKRPFKNLPKNSMELALKYATADSVCTGMGTTSALAYAQYREQCLSQLKPTKSELNKNMRRILTSKTDDPEYLEKRRRNNDAAKKSRECRKAKEDELAIRVTFLEQENLTLRVKLAEIEREKNMLQNMLYYR